MIDDELFPMGALTALCETYWANVPRVAIPEPVIRAARAGEEIPRGLPVPRRGEIRLLVSDYVARLNSNG